MEVYVVLFLSMNLMELNQHTILYGTSSYEGEFVSPIVETFHVKIMQIISTCLTPFLEDI